MSRFVRHENFTFPFVGWLAQALSELGFKKHTQGIALLLRAPDGSKPGHSADLVIMKEDLAPGSADLGFKRSRAGYYPVVWEDDLPNLRRGRFLEEMRAAYDRHAAGKEPPPLSEDEEIKIGLGEYLDTLRATVAEHGWAVVPVLDSPTYAYSVGLFSNFGHPEIVIRGFHPTLMQQLINDMGDAIRAGEHFEPGRLYPQIIQGFSCPVVEVTRSWRAHSMLACANFHGTLDFPAVQLLLPDAAGSFPTDEACDPEYKRVQQLMNVDPPPPHAPPSVKPRRAARARGPRRDH